MDNLYALSALLDVPMNDILVAANLPELDLCNRSGRPKPAVQLFSPRARLDPYPPHPHLNRPSQFLHSAMPAAPGEAGCSV